MADTGVAVHPSDKRYSDLVGKHVWRPLAREKLPIVADEAIDPEFGTGVLKVTPAHDKVDFEIGQRHHLPIVDVLHADGRINCPAVPELDGLDRFEARKKAAELLKNSGLISKTEPYENNVGFSDRSEVPIEPRLSEQWFLRYPKTKEALAVVSEHLIRFFPAHWEKVYAQWLENIQDWCISRQVWWGHRIPAWYSKPETGKRKPESEEIYVGIEPPPDPENWTQDPDTLDTWFSSWLWAYETMDEETRKKFYPTSALVTAPDIIFFWVARMIIAGLEFKPGKSERDEDNIPFHDVFFTGLIRDKQGRKMSKSLGNSPDPLELIDKYGADGLRFGLMRIAPSGQDIRFDEKQIEEGRNFATKLWNVARFREMHGPSVGAPEIDNKALSIFAIEVLARLNETIGAIEAAYSEYRIQHRRPASLRFFLERLLRLVCGGGENGNLQRRRGEEKGGAGSDGFCPLGVPETASSVHATHYRRTLVAARSGQRVDPVRRTTGDDPAGGRRYSQQKETCLGDLPNRAGGPQFARGSKNSVQQKGALHFASGRQGCRERTSDNHSIAQRRRSDIGSTIQGEARSSGRHGPAWRDFFGQYRNR